LPLIVDRSNKEEAVTCWTTSIGATPVASTLIAPKSGYVQRVMASAAGTTTGTIAVAVSINNGADITGGALTIAAGSNSRAGSVLEFATVGASSGVFISEGDSVVFTPSGGGGASIQGAFGLVTR
jgi:hypothetical protein